MRPDEFVCPVCGETVAADARVCPECGADDETGWSDRTIYDDVGIEGADEFDYDEFLERELGVPRRRTSRQWVWGATAIVALAVFLWLLVAG